ncbi:MAG: hypothetical protein WDZ74_02180 [Candidatus Paceibacterota bacterium]
MKIKETLFALTRIALGWTFLWAFLDKTFGFGLATVKEAAWINGGSPTTGFLTHAVQGPFADTFSALAGIAWVDWFFMLGMLLVGIGLILGIAMRLSGFFGGVIMLLMYAAASIPLTNNPFVDDHIINALILFAFSLSDTGETLGFGKQWKRTGLVRKVPLLR